MTAKKDLKKRVRARQARTGERYTTALKNVKDAKWRTPRTEVVALPDISSFAAAAGLKCRAYCSVSLWDLKQSDEHRSQLMRTIFDRLSQALRVTASDPSTALLRGALLHGRPVGKVFPGLPGSFIGRLRLGIRGTSEDGRAIAFEAPDPSGAESLVIVARLWPSKAREPILLVGRFSHERVMDFMGLDLSPGEGIRRCGTCQRK